MLEFIGYVVNWNLKYVCKLEDLKVGKFCLLIYFNCVLKLIIESSIIIDIIEV